MENIIGEISDDVFGQSVEPLHEPYVRRGARGIVFNSNGQVAVFNESEKCEYKLPGGGIEEGETPEQAFEREVLEEVGLKVKDVELLGLFVENRTKGNFKQISYVFVSKLKQDTHQLHLTQKEALWGGRGLWMELAEARNKIAECQEKLTGLSEEKLYHVKFMVERDKRILDYFINLKNK